MLKQLDIFTDSVHHSENNRESELWLEDNYERLTDQCRKLFKMFIDNMGIHYTNLSITHKTGILDPRARIRDLRNNKELSKKYIIKDKRIEGRQKEYWLEKITY